MSTVATPGTSVELLALFRKSGLYDEKPFREHFRFDDELPADARECATALIRAGFLTNFQAKQLLAGRHRGFTLGTYRILEPIGQGGMGVVFLGEHTTLKRRVAIKVLPAEKAKDKLSLERFYREARAAAALSHPNIVGLYDVSQGGGVHFLAMEYVEGTDLQALMAKTGPLHYAQAASYVAQAAAGLQHAHGKGIVHRDIKPANLILAKDGVIKLLDLGLARSLSNEADALTGLLGDGEVAGTADYIAPEQALGQPADERADIYSLGATLYALVAGHPPFTGSTTQKLMQHQLKEPPSLTKKLAGRVPPALAEVVVKMMSKRPADRYQTPEDVIDALGPWLPAPTTGSIVSEPLTPSGTKAVRSMTRKKRAASKREDEASGVPKWVWGAVAGAALMFVVVGGAAVLLSGDSKPATNRQSGSYAAAPPPAFPPQGATPLAPAAKPRPPRVPLAALPGDEQFVPISLAKVVNVTTNRLKFDPRSNDALLLNDWSDRRIEGVPFNLLPPLDDEPNLVQFFGTLGQAMTMPKSVTVPVGVAASQLHFLSGVSAWGFPRGESPRGALILRVVIRYEGGRSEEYRWENGIHFCDYLGDHDVPESKHAISFGERRTMRYLSIAPALDAVVKEVEFVKDNEDDKTSPMLMAITAERRGAAAKTMPAPAAAPAAEERATIPLELPDAPGQPAASVALPTGPVTVGGVTFVRPSGNAGVVVLGPRASAKVNCFLAAKAVHVLGSVGPPASGGLLKVRLHYAGGQIEDHEWKAGDGTAAGETLRMFTVTPRRSGVVQFVGFENAAPTTPLVLGVAVEAL